MARISLQNLKLEKKREAVTVELIHQDGDDLRINIIDRCGMMVNRIELAVDDDMLVLKTWRTERWEKNDPDYRIPLALAHL